jgi:hypothetical protein
MVDLEAIGLVGEEDKGLLVYLCQSSRHLKKPLSIIIKGPSGSGKDEIQRRPADLMPPEEIVDGMSITPNALYYNEEGWLRHKIVLGGERSHQKEDDPVQRDRTAAIRQMLSHGYITKTTVIQMQTVEIRQPGPISYSETTTKASIFQEDANRCLQIETDDSKKLTRKVVQALGGRYEPGPEKSLEDIQKIKEEHREFQKALKYVDVRIPYQAVLADKIPVERIEMRRIFNHVLTLIEVITYLHQFQRTPNRYGQLEATLADFGVARSMILGPLQQVLGLGKDFGKYVAMCTKLPDRFFTNTAAEALGAQSRKVIHSWLDRMVGLGLVFKVDTEISQKCSLWEKTGKGKNPEDLVLPRPETVATILRYRVTEGQKRQGNAKPR